MKNKFRVLSILFSLILFSFFVISCSDDDEKKREEEEDLINKYVENNPPDKKTETGVYYYSLQEGQGDLIKKKDNILVHYKIFFLKSGGVIRDTYLNNNPTGYRVGYYSTPPYIDDAFLYMKKGGKAKIVAPSKYGYGEYGNTTYGVGEFEPIICEVYIVDVKPYVEPE